MTTDEGKLKQTCDYRWRKVKTDMWLQMKESWNRHVTTDEEKFKQRRHSTVEAIQNVDVGDGRQFAAQQTNVLRKERTYPWSRSRPRRARRHCCRRPGPWRWPICPSHTLPAGLSSFESRRTLWRNKHVITDDSYVHDAVRIMPVTVTWWSWRHYWSRRRWWVVRIIRHCGVISKTSSLMTLMLMMRSANIGRLCDQRNITLLLTFVALMLLLLLLKMIKVWKGDDNGDGDDNDNGNKAKSWRRY